MEPRKCREKTPFTSGSNGCHRRGIALRAGQHQFGIVDIKGSDLDLWQRNTTVIVPFLVSSDGYGILWDNTPTPVWDLREFSAIPAENLFDKDGKQAG